MIFHNIKYQSHETRNHNTNKMNGEVPSVLTYRGQIFDIDADDIAHEIATSVVHEVQLFPISLSPYGFDKILDGVSRSRTVVKLAIAAGKPIRLMHELELIRSLGVGEGAEGIARCIEQCPSLQIVQLCDIKIEAAGAAAIANAIRRSNGRLSVLRMNNVQLDNAGAIALAQGVRHSSLTVLNLYHNMIGATGMEAILVAVAASGTMVNLNLGMNAIESWHVREGDPPFLADVVSRCAKLQMLSLVRCNLTTEHMIPLGDAIGRSTSLVELDLHGNMGGYPGHNAIFRGIGECKTFKSLDISNSSFWYHETVELARAIEKNATFEDLDVSGCQMSSEDAVYLLNGVAKSRSMKTLNMNGNPLNNECATHIAATILASASLTILEVARTNMTKVGLRVIAEAVAEKAIPDRFFMDDREVVRDVMEVNGVPKKLVTQAMEARHLELAVRRTHGMRNNYDALQDRNGRLQTHMRRFFGY